MATNRNNKGQFTKAKPKANGNGPIHRSQVRKTLKDEFGLNLPPKAPKQPTSAPGPRREPGGRTYYSG